MAVTVEIGRRRRSEYSGAGPEQHDETQGGDKQDTHRGPPVWRAPTERAEYRKPDQESSQGVRKLRRCVQTIVTQPAKVAGRCADVVGLGDCRSRRDFDGDVQDR